MEPKFQTSFIPKNPVIATSGQSAVASRSGNIFSMLAGVLFVITVLVSGGLFIYKNILESKRAAADQSLSAAREAFQPEKIQELIDVDSRIVSAKVLLDKHVAISGLLSLLQNLTVRNIRFDNMLYARKGDGSVTLSLDAEAATYNALALEQDIFSKNESMKNPEFSNFSLSENGTVKAKFFANLSPALLSYKKLVDTTPENVTSELTQ
jgi:hypothetical protein